jgi:hypothetical protein
MLYKHALLFLLPVISCLPLEGSTGNEKQSDSLLLPPRAECGPKDVKCPVGLVGAIGTPECEGKSLYCNYAWGFVITLVGECALCNGKWVPDRKLPPYE